MNREERDATVKLVDDHCSHLMEHFDTVQIFVSHKEGNNTMTLARGAGNWYARYGQVKIFCVKQEAIEGHDAIQGGDGL
jgi:hypothetical protein